MLGLFRNRGQRHGRWEAWCRYPQQQYGLVLSYRVFNKVSYGLVMTAKRPVNINDVVRNPS